MSLAQPVDESFHITSHFGPRDGGYHWGTDYGRDGGSGGHPVHAIKDGRVTRSGPASGFGRWVTINSGDIEHVYGHIIPEVSTGEAVTTGQRIARIDPNSATNGGVAPHLHLEIHRGQWQHPGPGRLNPATHLSGAPHPGGQVTTAHSDTDGVLYGIDVSEWQDNFNLRDAVNNAGLDFVILRTSDGTHADRLFRSHLDDVERSDALVAVYFYLRAPSEGTTIAQQVDTVAHQLDGRTDLGVWIDVESVDRDNRALLTGSDVWDAKRELESRGLHVPGIYTGRWYWEHMPGGEPSMDGLGHLWASDYGLVDRTGTPAAIYTTSGGNDHRGWSYPLGDRTPDILQIGSRGIINGYAPVDVNAYRGTRAELTTIFNPHTIKETIMSELSGVSAAALDEAKRNSARAVEILEAPISSLINGTKAFKIQALVALIDRASWENRELLKAICDKLGIDWQEVINEAIKEDRRHA